MFKFAHLKALLILILYVILTRGLFIAMIVYPNTLIAISLPTFIAAISGFLFLYFFTHHFNFARIIKSKKIKTEERLLHRFIFLGKFLASLTIGFIGGPLFAALTISLLLPTYKHKYLFVIFISAISILISICIARGIFESIYWLALQ